jgi:hypothetical protein
MITGMKIFFERFRNIVSNVSGYRASLSLVLNCPSRACDAETLSSLLIKIFYKNPKYPL